MGSVQRGSWTTGVGSAALALGVVALWELVAMAPIRDLLSWRVGWATLLLYVGVLVVVAVVCGFLRLLWRGLARSGVVGTGQVRSGLTPGGRVRRALGRLEGAPAVPLPAELFGVGVLAGFAHGWPVARGAIEPLLGRGASLAVFGLIVVFALVGARHLARSAVELALCVAALAIAALGLYLLRAEPLGLPPVSLPAAVVCTLALALGFAGSLRLDARAWLLLPSRRGRLALLGAILVAHALAVRGMAPRPHGVLADDSTTVAVDSGGPHQGRESESGGEYPEAAVSRTILPAADREDVSDRPGRSVSGAPPVFFLVVDTLRADAIDLESAGTPSLAPLAALSALAAESDRFPRAIANASWTIPGHASLFTGLRVSAHRVDMTSTAGFGPRLDRSIPTLHERFAEAGYRTSCVSANGIVGPGSGLTRGCERYRHPGRVWTLQTLPLRLFYALSPSARPALEEQLLTELTGLRRQATVGEVVDLALAELGRGSGAPSRTPYLFLNFMDVHKPYPSRLSGRERWVFLVDLVRVLVGLEEPEAFDRAHAGRMHRAYLAEAARLDAGLGRLFDGLRARGLYDDALIVVTADHGEAFYENPELPLYYDHHGAYEPAVRIPLLVKRPGLHPGRRFDRIVEQADVAPAVLALAGLASTPLEELALYSRHPGHAVTEWNPHPTPGAMSTLPHARAGLYRGRYKVVLEGSFSPAPSVVGDRTALGDRTAPSDRTISESSISLFDLEISPYEEHDVSSTQADRAALLAQELRRALEEARNEDSPVALPTAGPDPDLLRNLRSLGYIE